MSERLDGHSSPTEHVVVKGYLPVKPDVLACCAVANHFRVHVVNLTSIRRQVRVGRGRRSLRRYKDMPLAFNLPGTSRHTMLVRSGSCRQR